MQVIDADGHIVEGPWVEEIGRYMPRANEHTPIFPRLDHLHQHFLREQTPRESGRPVGPQEWGAFLDEAGIAWTVVYPTAGLAVGRITSEDFAVAACRAYNSWLYDHFLNASPRIKGMALIPVQDPQAAAQELRRSVAELGMCGAMLPSNGEGLKAHLGSKLYWPIYEEAQRLGCSLAIHGGCHHHLGMDTFGVYYPVNALGHPFGIMVQAAGMLSHGVFERFPGLRVGYLEGGAAWVPFFLDRMDRAFHQTHFQVDLEGDPATGPRPEERASDHFRRHVLEGRIFVGFDVDDEGLGSAVQRAGREPFMYATDFPHEGRTARMCRAEIDELLEREDLTDEDKEAVLGGNALRFYPLAAR